MTDAALLARLEAARTFIVQNEWPHKAVHLSAAELERLIAALKRMEE